DGGAAPNRRHSGDTAPAAGNDHGLACAGMAHHRASGARGEQRARQVRRGRAVSLLRSDGAPAGRSRCQSQHECALDRKSWRSYMKSALIVDGEPSIGGILEEVLKSEGMETVTMAHGSEAADYAR